MIHSFSKRQQYVSFNGINSMLQDNPCGVPQGSTLGPLLFLLYINDIPNSIQNVPRLFADDTCLILSHSNLLSKQANLNREVSNIYNTLQNKAVKIVGGGNFWDHATQFYHKLNILRVTGLETTKLQKFYISVYGNSPTSFSNYFVETSNVSETQN